MVDIASWGWPQFVYVGLTFIGLGLVLARSGQKEVKTHNFWIDILASIPTWVCLYFGGFLA